MITVSGKVIDSTGQPVQSTTVVIIGKGSTTSDVMGNFSFTAVTVPYDLATTAGSGAFITVMKGVTRADPTITSFATPGTPNTGTITGSFGGSAVLPNSFLNRSSQFMFESPETTGNATVTGSDAGYSVSVSWYGTTTTTGTVHALQLTRSNTTQLPTAYGAYGTNTGIVLANSNTAMGRNVSGTAVTSQMLSGMVTVPAVSALMLSSKTFSLRVGNGSIPLGSDATMNATFSYTTPLVASSSITFTAVADGQNRRSTFTRYGLASNASGVMITLASPPQLSIPATGATGIALASQSFSWAPMNPNGLYQVAMLGGGRAFVVFTSQTSVVIPSTVELGLGMFTANTNFNWQVTGIGGGATTVDQLLGPRGTSLEAPAMGDTWTGRSEARAFTGQ